MNRFVIGGLAVVLVAGLALADGDVPLKVGDAALTSPSRYATRDSVAPIQLRLSPDRQAQHRARLLPRGLERWLHQGSVHDAR